MSPKWIYDNYGSRKGFLISNWHQLLNVFGRYQYTIPWSSIERLVFVCTGNICRSAFAEAVAHSIEVPAISAGIHTIENAPADEQAIITANKLGYDLTNHRTTPIVYQHLKKSDLLIAMEPWQALHVKENLARCYSTTLLGLWFKPMHPHIYDPYNSSPEYFEHCFKYIEKSVYALADKIRSEHQNQ